MNCKPGDLAILVSSVKGQVGRFVEVVEWRGHAEFDSGRVVTNAWWCKGVGMPLKGEGHERPGLSTIPDADLRPIRDPGDDAADESKAWLPPVPTTTKEFV